MFKSLVATVLVASALSASLAHAQRSTPPEGPWYSGYLLQFNAEIGGRRMVFKNGYSRDIGTVALAQRYIVIEDPKIKLASYPSAIREAVSAGKVVLGMTREQVLMTIGYPVSTENPTLDARVWRFWLDSWTEFHVNFDDAGRVEKLVGEPATLGRVTMR